MIPNLNFVKETFTRFNTEIFGSQLPEPRFRLTHARSFRGKLVYRWRRVLLKKECYDFEIRISMDFDSPRPEWEDVVIHEMIHLLIASKGLNDSSSHGPVFRRLMTDINARHGRHITISTRTSKEEADNDTRIRGHVVCVARFRDGRFGVAPVARSRIAQLWDAFPAFPQVEAIRWLGTTDPWFNRFPRVIKQKLYLATREDLLAHLKGAVEYERDGCFLRPLHRGLPPEALLP